MKVRVNAALDGTARHQFIVAYLLVEQISRSHFLTHDLLTRIRKLAVASSMHVEMFRHPEGVQCDAADLIW